MEYYNLLFFLKRNWESSQCFCATFSQYMRTRNRGKFQGNSIRHFLHPLRHSVIYLPLQRDILGKYVPVMEFHMKFYLSSQDIIKYRGKILTYRIVAFLATDLGPGPTPRNLIRARFSPAASNFTCPPHAKVILAKQSICLIWSPAALGCVTTVLCDNKKIKD